MASGEYASSPRNAYRMSDSPESDCDVCHTAFRFFPRAPLVESYPPLDGSRRPPYTRAEFQGDLACRMEQSQSR